MTPGQTAGPPVQRPRDLVVPRPAAATMLSRVAAALYWMSRSLERAENVARLLDVNLQLLIDFGTIDDQQAERLWLPILQAAGDEAGFFECYDRATGPNVTEFMTFRRENPNSLLSCICAARENARQVRDQISIEMWFVLNECYLFMHSDEGRAEWASGTGAFYERIKKFSHLFQGLTDATFPRTEGWEFIQFGKFLERADKTTCLLDVKYHILLPKPTDVGGAVDTAQWQAVLRSVSALEAYRRYYVAEILPWKVAEFLVLSKSFPRSLRYCLDRLDESLHNMARLQPAGHASAVEESFARIRSEVANLSIGEILERGLHEYLTAARESIARLGQHLFELFMDHPSVDMAAEVRIHQQEQQQQQSPVPDPAPTAPPRPHHPRATRPRR
jgi:uncharacterized alpha-E superfamily protein